MKGLTTDIPRNRLLFMFGLSLVSVVVAACASSQLVSKDLEAEISRDITFAAVKADPAQFTGKDIVLGGKVLSAKLLKGQTQIELLQLPLDKYDRPIPELIQSKGRFLAFQTEALDPATVPAGTLVSLVGKVTGSKTLPVDEEQYTYPTINVVTLKIWEPRSPMYAYDPWYPYYGYGAPWGPRRYWYPSGLFYPWGPYWGPGWY